MQAEKKKKEKVERMKRMYKAYASAMVLKHGYIGGMIRLQKYLNKFIFEVSGADPTVEQVTHAMMSELGEIIDEFKPEWKWWGNGSGSVDADKVLEEFVDFWHFFLTYLGMFDRVEKYLPRLEEMLNMGFMNRAERSNKYESFYYVVAEVASQGSLGNMFVDDVIYYGAQFLKSLGFKKEDLFNKYVEKSFENYLRQVEGNRYGKVSLEELHEYLSGVFRK